MTLKKRFPTPGAANDMMYKIRRAGGDASVRGRFVTLYTDVCGLFINMRDDQWQIINK